MVASSTARPLQAVKIIKSKVVKPGMFSSTMGSLIKNDSAPWGGSVFMTAIGVVSVPHLLLPARQEALTVAPIELLGAVVLVRRQDRGRWLPAIVELWGVRWDVFWPAGPDRRAKALSHSVHFDSLCPSVTSPWGAVVPGDVPAVS